MEFGSVRRTQQSGHAGVTRTARTFAYRQRFPHVSGPPDIADSRSPGLRSRKGAIAPRRREQALRLSRGRAAEILADGLRWFCARTTGDGTIRRPGGRGLAVERLIRRSVRASGSFRSRFSRTGNSACLTAAEHISRSGKTVTNSKDIGRLIRETRRAQNLRQDQLAGAVGVGVRFIVELEAGKPTTQIGKTLAVLEALGCAVRIDPPGGGP